MVGNQRNFSSANKKHLCWTNWRRSLQSEAEFAMGKCEDVSHVKFKMLKMEQNVNIVMLVPPRGSHPGIIYTESK